MQYKSSVLIEAESGIRGLTVNRKSNLMKQKAKSSETSFQFQQMASCMNYANVTKASSHK